MNVLSIGSDENVFQAGSAARTRQEAYASALGHVDLVVLSRRPHAAEKAQNLSLFAAHAPSPFARLFLAYQAARALQKPDVVTVQDPFEIGFFGWLLARRFGVPLHVQVHTDFLDTNYATASLVNRVRVLIARFVLPRASRIRVVSDRIKTKLQTQYHPKATITVLPIFVDVERFRNATVPTALAARFETFALKVLVPVARLEPEKRVDLAIRAFAAAAPMHTCLLIFGEGSERERLAKLAGALKVSDNVFFEGVQDLAPYYALCDLVVLPSLYEGYGLVIIEALAAGKPVLSTDVGVARQAGAIIASEREFSKDLKQWFENGPRAGHLENYPYTNFDQYVRAYSEDIQACTNAK